MTRFQPWLTSGFFLGLDLGQASDYTALCVIERRVWRSGHAPSYACRHLQRFSLGTSYQKVVEGVENLIRATSAAGEQLLPGATLVIDATGVGRAVVDMFRQARLPARVVPITITGGQSVNFDNGCFHVPKKELVSRLRVLFQDRRLRIAPALPEAEALRNELQTFQVKITPAGNETFGSWRHRDHDDLVLAMAVALWYAENDRHEQEFRSRGLRAGRSNRRL